MEVEIGKVTHYYNHLGVAVITLTDGLKLGDKIHIVGHTTDFTQRVASMEVEHHSVIWIKPGDQAAVRVVAPVHENDVVLRVVEEIFEPVT